MPMDLSRNSIRLMAMAEPASESLASIRSTSGWRTRALPGSMTSLAGFFSSRGSGRPVTRSPSSTIDLPWEMRVQLRSMTGVS